MIKDNHVKVKNAEKRLSRFYGDVANSQNKEIIKLITGMRILDVGCGYGFLIRQIRKEKANAEIIGIDIDPESIEMASRLYGIDVRNMSVFKLDFPDGYFDTVILREAVHHFNTHDNLKAALNEIKRVCGKELIIFDPNPNLMLRLCRKLIRHVDQEAPCEYVVKALEENGFMVSSLKWRDIIAFPLSGGFISMELVPNIKICKDLVMALDRGLNAVLSGLKIQRHFCLRYLIYAIKKDADVKRGKR